MAALAIIEHRRTAGISSEESGGHEPLERLLYRDSGFAAGLQLKELTSTNWYVHGAEGSIPA